MLVSMALSTIRGFKLRLRPTADQRKRLDTDGHWCRSLFNRCLGRLKARYDSWLESMTWEPDFWDATPPSVSRIGCIELATEVARERGLTVHSQAVQQVGLHLWTAYENFFLKRAKFPQFKRKHHGWSLHFPQIKPAHITDTAVRIPGLGWVKAIVSFSLADITGNGNVPKSLVVRFDGDHYTVSILVESPYVAPAAPIVGIDRGIRATASCSDGTVFHAPVATHAERRRLKRCKRSISRKQKGSNRRAKSVDAARKTQRKIIRRVTDAIHVFTTTLAKTKPVIVLEDLNTHGMTASAAGTVEEPGTNVRQKSGLNRSILEQGWGAIQTQLQYKCLRYGSTVATVPAAHTSQTCAVCGHIDAQSRHGARFHCTACSHQDDADHNASLVIKSRWLSKGCAIITNVPVGDRKRTWRKPCQRTEEMSAASSQHAQSVNCTTMATLP
jgi:putative transposase